MKKFESLGRSLSKGEQKNEKGSDYEGGGGQCIGCSQYGTSYYSCWHTSQGCAVCAAVYPIDPQCLGPVGCSGCTL